jgi:type VI secretion system protein ImpD
MVSGGSVDLIREYFIADADEFMPKNAVEYQFTDTQEKLLSEEGFLAIRDNRFIERGIFCSSQSVQIPSKVHTGIGMSHAQMAAMLNYILCVSRFAHYIKIIIRDKVGKFLTANECEHYLSTWLRKYCSTTQSESIDAKARYPLNDAKVEVMERAGMQGKYYCIMRLKPQYQLDTMEMYLKLVTDIKIGG